MNTLEFACYILGPQYIELLQFIGQGRSDEYIAEQMGWSVVTVKNRKSDLYDLLELKKRDVANAALYAVKIGLVKPEEIVTTGLNPD